MMNNSFKRKTLRLSDAFKAPSDKLELIVQVYNLATGKNDALKSICKPLQEYSIDFTSNTVNRISISVWDCAEKFVKSNPKDVFYEIVLGGKIGDGVVS